MPEALISSTTSRGPGVGIGEVAQLELAVAEKHHALHARSPHARSCRSASLAADRRRRRDGRFEYPARGGYDGALRGIVCLNAGPERQGNASVHMHGLRHAVPAERGAARPAASSARTSASSCRWAGRPGPRSSALAAGRFNGWRQHEPGIIGIGTQPSFAIGQRALLIRTPHGNVLWDCISLLDAATVTLIKGLGGLKAIAISHPHFYTTLVEWSRAFGGVPVHLHADDQRWMMRPDPCIKLVAGRDAELLPDVTLIRGGGHFPGGAMLHWAKGAGGPRRAVRGRHRHGQHGPQVLHLHAQLSEFHPALGQGRAGDRRGAGALPVRPGLQPLLRPLHRRRAPSRSCRPPSSAMWQPSAVPTIEGCRTLRVRRVTGAIRGPALCWWCTCLLRCSLKGEGRAACVVWDAQRVSTHTLKCPPPRARPARSRWRSSGRARCRSGRAWRSRPRGPGRRAPAEAHDALAAGLEQGLQLVEPAAVGLDGAAVEHHLEAPLHAVWRPRPATARPARAASAPRRRARPPR